jgi:hypothetical protein
MLGKSLASLTQFMGIGGGGAICSVSEAGHVIGNTAPPID